MDRALASHLAEQVVRGALHPVLALEHHLLLDVPLRSRLRLGLLSHLRRSYWLAGQFGRPAQGDATGVAGGAPLFSSVAR